MSPASRRHELMEPICISGTAPANVTRGVHHGHRTHPAKNRNARITNVSMAATMIKVMKSWTVRFHPRSSCNQRPQVRRSDPTLEGEQVERWRLAARDDGKDCVSLAAMVRLMIEQMGEDVSPSLFKRLALRGGVEMQLR